MDREALVTRLSDSTLAFLEILTLYIGDRLGLYAALAEGGPATSAELAARTGTHERYVREWLEQQAASGLLEVDRPEAEAPARRFRLPAGHAEVLVDRESLHYQAARPKSLLAVARRLPAVLEAFRTGGGVQGDDAEAREAQAELGRVRFLRLLGTAWLPAVPDVHARLLAEPGARVADLGCGGGWSAIALASAYPQARVDGYDVDAPVHRPRAAQRRGGGGGGSRAVLRARRRRPEPRGHLRPRDGLRDPARHAAAGGGARHHAAPGRARGAPSSWPTRR